MPRSVAASVELISLFYPLAFSPGSLNSKGKLVRISRILSTRRSVSSTDLSRVRASFDLSVSAGTVLVLPPYCCVYPPVKQFAREVLSNLGIETEYFDPTDLTDLAGKLRPGATRLVWIESPGSTSMELCDIPEVACLSKSVGALVGCDNTWATGLICKPLDLGVDIVAEALTKYVGGHSDILLGAIIIREMDLYAKLRRTLSVLGIGVSPDECSLALRGIQTMSLRLRHVGSVSEEFAERLPTQSNCLQTPQRHRAHVW